MTVVLGQASIAATLVGALALGGPPVQRPGAAQVEPELEPALRWEGPPECSDVERVQEQLIAYASELGQGGEATAWVHLEPRSAGGYAVEIVIRDRHGELRRELEAENCREAERAASLLIAVLLDPVATSRAVAVSSSSVAEVEPKEPVVEEPTEPEPAPEPAPAPPMERAAEPEPEPEVPPRWRSRSGEGTGSGEPRPSLGVAFGLFGGGGYGPTNTGTGSLGGYAALFGPRERSGPSARGWRAELAGGWTPPRTVRADGGELGGRFDAWSVSGRGCYVPAVGAAALELPICAGVEAGRVRGEGLEDLPIPLTSALNWVALGLGGGVRVPIGRRVALAGELQLAIPLIGGRFLIETTEVQRIAPVSVRGLFGVELRLP